MAQINKPFLAGLRVRIKELAYEAKLIRQEEQKAKLNRDTPTLERLHNHRIHCVRPHAREVQLAYGYLRGVPYRVIEQRTKTSPNWKQVRRLIVKFSDEDHRYLDQRLSDWMKA